jgi:hypothetical protein
MPLNNITNNTFQLAISLINWMSLMYFKLQSLCGVNFHFAGLTFASFVWFQAANFSIQKKNTQNERIICLYINKWLVARVSIFSATNSRCFNANGKIVWNEHKFICLESIQKVCIHDERIIKRGTKVVCNFFSTVDSFSPFFNIILSFMNFKVFSSK